MKKKVVIVGAGPGGLTAGMLLASKGYAVEIFETKDQVGGRNGTFSGQGFTFDIGPTFLMMLHILEEMFALTGRRLQDYMTTHSVLEDVETWEPSDVVRERILHMCRASLTVIYRHGAIVWRLLCTRMIKVEPSTGAVIVLSPSLNLARDAPGRREFSRGRDEKRIRQC